jgi:hypothetical protein
MPRFRADIEVFFEAESLRDADRIADDFGDVIADFSVAVATAPSVPVVISAITTGVAQVVA